MAGLLRLAGVPAERVPAFRHHFPPSRASASVTAQPKAHATAAALRRAAFFTRPTVRALLPLYRADYLLFDMAVPRWYAATAGEGFVRGLGLRVAGENGSAVSGCD